MDKIADKPEQLVHESETQRQYVRVDMPARARIDNIEYPVHNISAGGISIVSKNKPYRIGIVFDFYLIVPFQSFALDLPIKVEVEHYNKENGLLGCRFIDLNREQISIITHIVRGYIAGDLVTAGEILNVVSRNNFSKARAPVAAAKDGFPLSPKQMILLGAIFLLGLGAFYIIVSNFYQSAFTVQSVRGVVESDVQEIKSPQTGVFQNGLKADVKIVEPGQKLGRIVPSLLTGGEEAGVVELKSPCQCHVVSRLPGAEQYIEPGTSIFTLVPVDSKVWVSVVVEAGQAQKIAFGDHATIKVAGLDTEVTGKVVHYQTNIQDLKGGASEKNAGQGVTTIMIEPDQKLPIDLRGRPATVIFKL